MQEEAREMKYMIIGTWTKALEAEAGWDSPYGLEWADLGTSRGDKIFQGAWRVIDHIHRTATDKPSVVKTFKGESAWMDSRRLAGDLNMSAMFGTGVNR